jgi:glycosyltransferase involved in cell wall biosynthesis
VSVEGNARVLVVIPALNEEESVGLVVKDVAASVPDADILVIDDASSDRTAAVARAHGAAVLTNVFTLGVGGAMRVGFRFAQDHGHRALVQVDGDGQHDPRDIPKLLAELIDDERPSVVIGARFAGKGDFDVPRLRRLAMRMLASDLSRVTGTRLTDVTSGFRAHNRAAIELFARRYPADYLADTVESIVLASRANGRVIQVPVEMHPRQAGSSTASTFRASTYLARVSLMLALSIIRRRANPTDTEGAP